MFEVKVRPDNEDEYVIEVTSRDVVKWERSTKGASLSKLTGEGGSMEDAYKLTHFAAQRNDRFSGSLTEFQETNDIEILKGEEDSVPPTNQAA